MKSLTLCDIFALLVAPSSGDELQSNQEGIVEMANLIIITKNDGDLVKAARRMKGEIQIRQPSSGTILQTAYNLCLGSHQRHRKPGKRSSGSAAILWQKHQETQKIDLLKSSLVNELFETLCKEDLLRELRERTQERSNTVTVRVGTRDYLQRSLQCIETEIMKKIINNKQIRTP